MFSFLTPFIWRHHVNRSQLIDMASLILFLLFIANDRNEINQEIRREFEITRDITDEHKVSFFLTSGKRRIERMFGPIYFSCILCANKFVFVHHPFLIV
jgi:hypothetical protein